MKVVALGGSVTVGVGSMDPPKYGYPGARCVALCMLRSNAPVSFPTTHEL